MGIHVATDSRISGAILNRILIIDSDPNETSHLKGALCPSGYEIFCAKDGGQAHATFSMRKPDLVLVEALLEGDETGFEICERLKQQDSQVPIVIYSVIDSDRAFALGRRVGADDYLVKPMPHELLVERLRAVATRVWIANHDLDHSAGHDDGPRIEFSCECGAHLRMKRANRGKLVSCPKCGRPVLVPLHD